MVTHETEMDNSNLKTPKSFHVSKEVCYYIRLFFLVYVYK